MRMPLRKVSCLLIVAAFFIISSGKINAEEQETFDRELLAEKAPLLAECSAAYVALHSILDVLADQQRPILMEQAEEALIASALAKYLADSNFDTWEKASDFAQNISVEQRKFWINRANEVAAEKNFKQVLNELRAKTKICIKHNELQKFLASYAKNHLSLILEIENIEEE